MFSTVVTFLSSVAVSTALSAALVWLLQNWISERLKNAIKHEWHSVKPNTLGLKVLRTNTPARRPMINNMISI